MSKSNVLAFASETNSGMTLRDYFAAAALSAYFDVNDSPSEFSMVARRSYLIADCMLKVREQA